MKKVVVALEESNQGLWLDKIRNIDPWFLVGRYGDKAKLIRAAREVNSYMPHIVANRIDEIMKENDISDYNEVGLYGLTYKEDINDIRESPTLQLLSLFKESDGRNYSTYDPYVKTTIVDSQFYDLRK